MDERPVLYAIYDHPSDFPNSFVIRRWTMVKVQIAGDAKAEVMKVADALPFAVGPTLEAVRRALPKGLYNLGREKDDDPCIAETWV